MSRKRPHREEKERGWISTRWSNYIYIIIYDFCCCSQIMHKEVAQVAQIFGGVNTLSGYVGTESVSAEFSTTASEP